jgi:hypothetical protein
MMSSALRKLDDETKLKFIDVFTKRNHFLSLGSVVLIILFLLGMQFFPQHRRTLIVGYSVALFSFMCVKFFINYKKLKEINVPPEYFRSFFASYGTFLLAIIAAVICGAWVGFA